MSTQCCEHQGWYLLWSEIVTVPGYGICPNNNDLVCFNVIKWIIFTSLWRGKNDILLIKTNKIIMVSTLPPLPELLLFLPSVRFKRSLCEGWQMFCHTIVTLLWKVFCRFLYQHLFWPDIFILCFSFQAVALIYLCYPVWKIANGLPHYNIPFYKEVVSGFYTTTYFDLTNYTLLFIQGHG